MDPQICIVMDIQKKPFQVRLGLVELWKAKAEKNSRRQISWVNFYPQLNAKFRIRVDLEGDIYANLVTTRGPLPPA